MAEMTLHGMLNVNTLRESNMNQILLIVRVGTHLTVVHMLGCRPVSESCLLLLAC